MDQAEKTIVENLHKNTGKTLEQWIEIVKAKNFAKHGEIMKFLKEEHAFTHGFANMVALKSRAADAGSVENKDELIEKQYKGKEHFKPVYDALLSEIRKFGSDVEVSPKNAYVSLRRKKQFAMLGPATNTRFEVGLNMKGVAATERLLEQPPGGMCNYKVKLLDPAEVDDELVGWVRQAYDSAA